MGGEPATSGHDPEETERIEALLAEWTELGESGEFDDIEFHDLASLRSAIADEIERVSLEVFRDDLAIDFPKLRKGFEVLGDQLDWFRSTNNGFGAFLTPVHAGETLRTCMERKAPLWRPNKRHKKDVEAIEDFTSNRADERHSKTNLPPTNPLGAATERLELEQIRRWRAEIDSLAEAENALASPELIAAGPSKRDQQTQEMVMVAHSMLTYLGDQLGGGSLHRAWTGHSDLDGLLRAAFRASFPNRTDQSVKRQKADALYVLIESYDSAGLAFQQLCVLLLTELAIRQGGRLVLAANEEGKLKPTISDARAAAVAPWASTTLDRLEDLVLGHGQAVNTKYLRHTIDKGARSFARESASRMLEIGSTRAAQALHHWARLCRATGNDDLATWEQQDG